MVERVVAFSHYYGKKLMIILYLNDVKNKLEDKDIKTKDKDNGNIIYQIPSDSRFVWTNFFTDAVFPTILIKLM